MRDAWAPYDSYIGPAHQLCCAHALRELQIVLVSCRVHEDHRRASMT